MRSAWGSRLTAGPSTSISSTAPASSGSPRWSQSSTSAVVCWSMISIAAGTMPAAMVAETVRHASTMVAKSNSMVLTAAGRGSSRTQISVTTASVPSLPTITESRSTSGRSALSPPSVTTVPSWSTATSPSTWLNITPYLRQCGPPALVETLPPSVLTCCEAGSGAK